MAIKKPTHQWETRQHRAVRRLVDGATGDGPPVEVMDLEFGDGRRSEARLSLVEQRVESWAVDADPDLIHAVGCWVVARGARTLACSDETGRLVGAGPIDLAALGDAVDAPAGRVITLAPSNAELIQGLGAFDRVVACEASSDFPPEVRRCERLGPDLAPDLDRVAELAPDVVLSSLTVPGMERIVTGLRARGVPQLVFAPRSVDDVLEDLRRLGQTLGLGPAAEVARGKLAAEREALRSRRTGEPRRVYLEWWPRPMFTPGRDCFSNEVIALAGGVNVFGDRPGASFEVSPAEVLAADPDVCFVSWCGVSEAKLDVQNLIGRPGLAGLRAAEQGRVFVLDEAFAGRPGPRMLEAARRMAAVFEGVPAGG